MASRVGCSERLEMVAVRDLDLAWPGGLVRVLVERRDLERVSKVVILVEGLKLNLYCVLLVLYAASSGFVGGFVAWIFKGFVPECCLCREYGLRDRCSIEIYMTCMKLHVVKARKHVTFTTLWSAALPTS